MLSCNLCSCAMQVNLLCSHRFALMSSTFMLKCVNQEELKLLFLYRNSRHIVKRNCLCGFQTASCFWHSVKNWRPLLHHQRHHLMDRHPFLLNMLYVVVFLDFSECSTHLFTGIWLLLWQVLSGHVVFGFGWQLSTQGPKLKASRRFCVNGGTMVKCFLNLYVHRRWASKLHVFLLLQSEAVKRFGLLQYFCDCYDEYTAALWMSQRKIFFIFFFQCGPPSAD